MYVHDKKPAYGYRGKIREKSITDRAEARDKAENRSVSGRRHPSTSVYTSRVFFSGIIIFVYFSFYHREPSFSSRTTMFESVRRFISFIRLPNIYRTIRRGRQRTGNKFNDCEKREKRGGEEDRE